MFVLGPVERPETVRRKSPVYGGWAIRVPQGDSEDRALAPSAYCAPGADPLSLKPPRSLLFEDAERQKLLCQVGPGIEDGRARRHEVRDGQGRVIGALHRHKGKNWMASHTWRLEQPGRPEIVGQKGLATSGLARVFGAGVDMVSTGLVDAVFSRNGETTSSDPGASTRRLDWVVDGEVIMSSRDTEWGTACAIRADWLDRRLAFAFALLGDE